MYVYIYRCGVQVGGVQAAAALVSYYIVFIDNGFSPADLINKGPPWDDHSVVMSDSYGRVSECGRRVSGLVTGGGSLGGGGQGRPGQGHRGGVLQQEWSEPERRVLLQTAQTACFLAIVWTQIADLLICRCRRDSLLSRGCTNWQLNSAVLSQVSALLCSAPQPLSLPISTVGLGFGPILVE